MTAATLPPMIVDAPRPTAAQRALRWSLVVAGHLGLAGAGLYLSVRQDLLPLPPSLAVRLLPLAEEKKPEPPPPPKQPPTARKSPLPPQPVLASRAPSDTAPAFAVPPQPPAPAPAPVVAAPPAAPAPLAVTAPRFDADYLHNPKPAYPAVSRRNGEEGRVLLRVRVSADGSALAVDVKESSSYARLDAAAREAVARWRFVPARRGEEAVESAVVVPITFALD